MTAEQFAKFAYAKFQGAQIRVGEALLDAFPFLEPPTERMVQRIDRWQRRWVEKRGGAEPNWFLLGSGMGFVIVGIVGLLKVLL